MLSYIKLIYNGYKYYRNNDIIDDKKYRDHIKNIINDCGIYTIKLMQTLIPYIKVLGIMKTDIITKLEKEYPGDNQVMNLINSQDDDENIIKNIINHIELTHNK